MINIRTIEELQLIGNHVDYPINGEYRLYNNIDASGTSTWNAGAGFIPIGTYANPFTGTLDGNGKSINSIRIAGTSSQYTGLFYRIGSLGKVYDLALTNVYVRGYITGALAALLTAGGLVRNCYSTGTVFKNTVSSNGCIGGLIGEWQGGNLENSFSLCRISGYGVGTLNTGGLVGKKGITQVPVSCYYATDIGNVNNSIGTGLTTAQFASASSFVGWDFNDLWEIDSVLLYPVFRVPVGYLFKDHFKVYSQDKLIYTGLIDTLFDPNTETTPNSGVFDIIEQTDGKYILSGWFGKIGGVAKRRIARVNNNGSLDITFTCTNNASVISKVLLQADGKILIIGIFTTVGGATRNRMARLNSDGSLDATFPDLSPDGLIHTMALQSDGKILVGGGFSTIGGVSANRIVRLNTNGTVDGTFSGSMNSPVYSILILDDGKILVGGISSVYGPGKGMTVRLNTDGTLDAGYALGSSIVGSTDSVYSMAVQSDGKYIIGGSFSKVNGTSKSNIARLNSDGTLDTSFTPVLTGNSSGALSFPIVRGIAILDDDDILITGAFIYVDSVLKNGTARLHAEDGSLNTDFDAPLGEDGSLGKFGGLNVYIDSKGYPIIVGYFTKVQTTVRYHVVKLNPDVISKYIKEEFFWVPEYISDTTKGAFEVTDITGNKNRFYIERGDDGLTRYRYEDQEWSSWFTLTTLELANIKIEPGPSTTAGTCIIRSRCIRNNVISGRNEEDLYLDGPGDLNYYSLFFIEASADLTITGLNNTDETGVNLVWISEPVLLVGELPDVVWDEAPAGITFYESLDGLTFSLNAGQSAYVYTNRIVNQESAAGLYNREVVVNYILDDDPDVVVRSAELIGTHLIGRTDAVTYNLYGEENTDPTLLPSVSSNLLSTSATLPITYEPTPPAPGSSLYVALRVTQVNRYGAESLNKYLEHIVQVDSDGADADVPPTPTLVSLEILQGGTIRVTATLTVDPDKTRPTAFGCQLYNVSTAASTYKTKGFTSSDTTVTGYFYFDALSVLSLFNIRLFTDSETKDRQYTSWYQYESIYDEEEYLDQFNMVGSHSASTFLVPDNDSSPWDTQISGLFELTFAINENEATYDGDTIWNITMGTDDILDFTGYSFEDGYTTGSPYYDLGAASVIAGYEVDAVNAIVYLVSNWRRIVSIDTVNKIVKTPNIYQASFPSYVINLPIVQTSFAVYWNIRIDENPYFFSYMKVQHCNSSIGASSVGLYINNVTIEQ